MRTAAVAFESKRQRYLHGALGGLAGSYLLDNILTT